MSGAVFRFLLFVGLAFAAIHPAAAQDWDQELAARRRQCDVLFTRWRTRDPQERTGLRVELLQAAIRAEQPNVIEEIAADGQLARKEIRLSRRARTVPLRELRTFDGIETTLGQEDGYQEQDSSPPKGWLVRRLTRDAWEVWTPTHGWLFDGKGQVLNEAFPKRGDGTGREWYGAFLPDGRWVTTDLESWDCALTFFSREGERTRQMASAELAPSGGGTTRRVRCWAGRARTGTARRGSSTSARNRATPPCASGRRDRRGRWPGSNVGGSACPAPSVRGDRKSVV